MQSATIETVHLLIGIIKHGGDDSLLLTEAGVNLRKLREYLEKRTTQQEAAKLPAEVSHVSIRKWQVEPYFKGDFRILDENKPIISHDESASDAPKDVEKKDSL